MKLVSKVSYGANGLDTATIDWRARLRMLAYNHVIMFVLRGHPSTRTAHSNFTTTPTGRREYSDHDSFESPAFLIYSALFLFLAEVLNFGSPTILLFIDMRLS